MVYTHTSFFPLLSLPHAPKAGGLLLLLHPVAYLGVSDGYAIPDTIHEYSVTLEAGKTYRVVIYYPTFGIDHSHSLEGGSRRPGQEPAADSPSESRMAGEG